MSGHKATGGDEVIEEASRARSCQVGQGTGRFPAGAHTLGRIPRARFLSRRSSGPSTHSYFPVVGANNHGSQHLSKQEQILCSRTRGGVKNPPLLLQRSAMGDGRWAIYTRDCKGCEIASLKAWPLASSSPAMSVTPDVAGSLARCTRTHLGDIPRKVSGRYCR